MCDPIGMIGMAFSIGSTIMQYQAQQDVMNKQEQANNEWLAYQRMKARQEDFRQENARKKADVSRMETLEELQGPKQEEAQGEEAKRLEGEMMPTYATLPEGGQLVGDTLLSGAGSKIQAHYADAITSATRDARERMKNLAVVASTTGSQFGLANRSNALLGQSADDIKLQGDIRQGSLLSYGVEKAVEPVKYAINPSAGMFGGIGQGLAGLAGKSMGAAAAGGSQSF